ncbi:MAG TPA: tetratricopeptide repeat-containing protein [Pyrinomonadaceae bacterium]|jgi:predicted acylesterase/phospholipase RssA|nr:tetratricopeptide repeat-containing protein [Pyrinomonadaceae bacterium]
MNTADSDNVRQAKAVLGGQAKAVPGDEAPEFKTLFQLAKRLKGENAFGYARRVLARALADPALDSHPDLKIEITQKYALYTYKDHDLPAHERYDTALGILRRITDFGRKPEQKQETLGLFGAIYKRKWEADGQKLNLERSALYYLAGCAEGVERNDGYTAINAAFVLDMLARQEEDEQREVRKLIEDQSGGVAEAAEGYGETAAAQEGQAHEQTAMPSVPERRRAHAGGIRKQLTEKLPEALEARLAERRQKAEKKAKAEGREYAHEDVSEEWDWWLIVTVAEAHFGLRQYEQAREWLRRACELHDRLKARRPAPGAKAAGINDMEWESTLRQLASIAHMQEAQDAAAKTTAAPTNGDGATQLNAKGVLSEFVGHRFRSDGSGGDAGHAVQSAITGRVGLGLSGGGFRASLFHIGVLAKLAELDALRSVEVISCVSGGSIVGAHYYLELRRLLQSKPDDRITREDYIDIVQRVERDFLAGVQRNIRTRIIAELWTNLKLIFWPSYTRTNRAGELYEREIYARVPDEDDAPQPPRREGAAGWLARAWARASAGAARLTGRDTRPRWLNLLRIQPRDGGEDFSPKYHNWRRRAKVPMLVLNATTLNTGHNWQFTASWMGEPPVGINSEVDASDRLRRMYYREAPERHQNVRLGYAVAASACVPGLFEPLVLERLYPERTIRLVDGGVQDNQGVTALLEQDCNVILVSDASGQMESVKDPKSGLLGRMLGGVLGVLLRTKDILMARVREAEFDDLSARRRASLLRGLMYIHLTKDLENDPVDWIGCDDPHYATEDARPVSRRGPRTRYGLRKEVQRLLAVVRTDLDSFTDAEAYALMASGYRMTEYEFPRQVKLPAPRGGPGPEPNWKFLAVEDRMMVAGDDPKYQSLVKQLKVSGELAFKAWRLSRLLQIFAGLLALCALSGAVYGLLPFVWPPYPNQPLVDLTLKPTRGDVAVYIVTTLATTVAGLLFGSWLIQIIKYKKTLTRALIHAGMGLLGWLVARVHIWVFDGMYKRIGRIRLRPDAFFCYYGEDERDVGRVDEWLRRRGCKTVVDGKDSLYSPARKRAIRRLIKDSSAFVFFSHGRQIPNDSCGRLYSFADGKRRRIAVVTISAAGTNGVEGREVGPNVREFNLRPDGAGGFHPQDLEELRRYIKNEPEPRTTRPAAKHTPNGVGGKGSSNGKQAHAGQHAQAGR